MTESGPEVSQRPAAPAKPASYAVSLLLILFVLVVSQVAGEAISAMRHAEEGAGSGSFVLLIAGAVALVGLVVINARWLWVTMGNLRFALALMTLWTVSSVLGTLVVQRLPNQNDDGYARTFTEATGDFLYNASHVGGGVIVKPTPDVDEWLAQHRRLFGADDAKELQKQWMGSQTARLRQAEIREWVDSHDTLLSDVLATVSWLRLPEAFQISVWFKALLGLLCTALVIVVIQRWRGEWRQIGWAMAHLGMVVFCIGASVRATMKVDGFLTMHVGQTADAFARKVDPALLGRDPDVRVDPRGDASRVTPLDFEFTLNRFKTEYPKHFFVTFGQERVEKSWLLSPPWKHDFMDGGLKLRVARLREAVATRLAHRDRPEGGANPAVLVTVTAPWLDAPVEEALTDHDPLWPPDFGYVAEYRRAADEAEYQQLLANEGDAGSVWMVRRDAAPEELGAAQPGAVLAIPGGSGLSARVIAVWPDWARRGEAEARPSEPAAELQLLRGGEPVGRVGVLHDRVVPLEGPPPDVELRFAYNVFGARFPVKYRLVDVAGRAPVCVTFRDGVVAETRDLRPGDELALGAAGDRLRLQSTFERHVAVWHTEPADTSGLSANDVYYASLPTEAVIEARGTAVEPIASKLAANFAEGADPAGALGLVVPRDFAAGDGQISVTDDGRGLLVRLVSDDRGLGTFPAELQATAFAAMGHEIPYTLNYLTDEKGPPLRFTSDVTLSKDGKLIKRALVEPNAPIYLAGFQFSQADFRHEEPTYSGFGVVRDPSVRIVYFGMGILVVGVILLFYVNPMFARRKARKTT